MTSGRTTVTDTEWNEEKCLEVVTISNEVTHDFVSKPPTTTIFGGFPPVTKHQHRKSGDVLESSTHQRTPTFQSISQSYLRLHWGKFRPSFGMEKIKVSKMAENCHGHMGKKNMFDHETHTPKTSQVRLQLNDVRPENQAGRITKLTKSSCFLFGFYFGCEFLKLQRPVR